MSIIIEALTYKKDYVLKIDVVNKILKLLADGKERTAVEISTGIKYTNNSIRKFLLGLEDANLIKSRLTIPGSKQRKSNPKHYTLNNL